MKRFNWLLIGVVIVCLGIVLLAGCGVPQSEYEALQAQHATLVDEKTALQAELETAQSDLSDLQADYDTLKADDDALKVDYDTLKADNDALQADYDTLKADRDRLSRNYNAATRELSEIKKVYPPREFSSFQELQDWLGANDVSDRPVSEYAEGKYLKALDIQYDALDDGYIISAWIDYYPDGEYFIIMCTAVVDGYVWAWDPETDELLNFSDGTGLLKLK